MFLIGPPNFNRSKMIEEGPNLNIQINPMQEMIFLGRSELGLSDQLILSCNDGQISVLKSSLFFIADHFKIGNEQFLASDIFILDELRVNDVIRALGNLKLLNVEEVFNLFTSKVVHTIQVDLTENFNFEDNLNLYEEPIEDNILESIIKEKEIVENVLEPVTAEIFDYQCKDSGNT